MIIDALESGKAEWAPPPMPKTMREVVEAYETQSAGMERRWAALPAGRWDGTLEFFGQQRPASPMAWTQTCNPCRWAFSMWLAVSSSEGVGQPWCPGRSA